MSEQEQKAIDWKQARERVKGRIEGVVCTRDSAGYFCIHVGKLIPQGVIGHGTDEPAAWLDAFAKMNPALQEQKRAESGEALSDERCGEVASADSLRPGAVCIKEKGHSDGIHATAAMDDFQARGFYWVTPQPSRLPSPPVSAGDGLPNDYPEDRGHENGAYLNKCVGCGVTFGGHKRRVICKVCATKLPTPTLDERTERERLLSEAHSLFNTMVHPAGHLMITPEWHQRRRAWLARAAQQPLAGVDEPDDREILEVIDERDKLEERLTALADAVGEFFGVPVGEWSSDNDPDKVALEILGGGYKSKVYDRAKSSAPPPQVVDVMESFSHSVTPPLVSEAGLPERPKASDGFSGDAIACDADQVDAYADAMEAQLRNALSERDAAKRQHGSAEASYQAALRGATEQRTRAEQAESERDQARADAKMLREKMTCEMVSVEAMESLAGVTREWKIRADKAEAGLAERAKGFEEWAAAEGYRLDKSDMSSDYIDQKTISARDGYLAGAKVQSGSAQRLHAALIFAVNELGERPARKEVLRAIDAALAAHRQQEAQ